jgi:hypothetical protein
MAFIHGKNTFISVNGIDISDYSNETGFPRTKDTSETTTFNKDGKTYIPGLKDSKLSLKGPFDPALDDVISAAYDSDALIPFVYGPAGNGTGSIRYTGNMIVTSYEGGGPVSDAEEWSAELQISDVPTRDTF